MEEKLKKAREEVTRIENENIKLMWKYAPWIFKLIIILGCLVGVIIFTKLGFYIRTLL